MYVHKYINTTCYFLLLDFRADHLVLDNCCGPKDYAMRLQLDKSGHPTSNMHSDEGKLRCKALGALLFE